MHSRNGAEYDNVLGSNQNAMQYPSGHCGYLRMRNTWNGCIYNLFTYLLLFLVFCICKARAKHIWKEVGRWRFVKDAFTKECA